MKSNWAIPVLASILILGTIVIMPALATHPGGPVFEMPFDVILDPTPDDVQHTNDGTLNGAAVYASGVNIAPVASNVGALDLDGTSGTNVSIPDNALLDLTGDFSISA